MTYSMLDPLKLPDLFLYDWLKSMSIWNALRSCNNISEICLFDEAIELNEFEQLILACDNVSLLMFNSIDILEPLYPLQIPDAFPNLRSLSIFGLEYPTDATILMNLFVISKRAPNRNTLKWRLYCDESRTDSPGFEEWYKLAMSSSVIFNDLDDLNLSSSDRGTAVIINSMTRAKRILCHSGFSDICYQSLMSRHSETIQELKISHCLGVTGAIVQGILSGCPLLQTFEADKI